MSEILITPFKMEDVDVYRELRIEMVCSHPDAFDVDLMQLLERKNEDWVADAKECLSDSNRARYIAKTEEGYPVGIVGLVPRDMTLEIGGLYVRRNYRSQHVGSLLVGASIEFAQSKSFSKASLWVSSANPQARIWYESLSFRPTNPPTLKQWWDGSGISEEYLERSLVE